MVFTTAQKVVIKFVTKKFQKLSNLVTLIASHKNVFVLQVSGKHLSTFLLMIILFKWAIPGLCYNFNNTLM